MAHKVVFNKRARSNYKCEVITFIWLATDRNVILSLNISKKIILNLIRKISSGKMLVELECS